MAVVRVNHSTKCCANCAYWEGNRKIERSYTEVDQSPTSKCGNRSAGCYNGSFNCHHQCSNHEQHPMAK